MANNQNKNGFHWVGNKYAPGAKEPPIMIYPVADDYATAIPRGYPVALASDGTITVASTGNNVVFGISDGTEQYWDGSVLRSGNVLPASTSYDTVVARQSRLRVIPVRGQLFRINCDDNTTATTQAAYEAFVGENVDWTAGTAVNGDAGCQIDISGHATTATLPVRIENVPDKETQDFSGTLVSLLVSFNLIQDTASGATLGT